MGASQYADQAEEAATAARENASLDKAISERDDAVAERDKERMRNLELRDALLAIQKNHGTAIELLLDACNLIDSPPDARRRWKERLDASGIIRVTEPCQSPTTS